MELGKVPPHDIEAEQAVIGSMLTDKDAVISAIEILKVDSLKHFVQRLAKLASYTSLIKKNFLVVIYTAQIPTTLLV